MSTIAVFDSGVGGLSVLPAIKALLPDNQFIFVSDNDGFPYGLKSDSWLRGRVLDVVNRIIEQYNPDVVVVACNTASTIALSDLRVQFNVEFVGVVPAIKPAAQLSVSKHIAVLATPATVNRKYTGDLIREYASDCSVELIGSSELVEIAERKMMGGEVDMARLACILEPITSNEVIDTVVLACTHFPILKAEINECLEKSQRVKIPSLIDSTEAIAQRVKAVLEREQASNAHSITDFQENVEEDVVVLTKQEPVSEIFTAYLEKNGFKQIDVLSV